MEKKWWVWYDGQTWIWKFTLCKSRIISHPCSVASTIICSRGMGLQFLFVSRVSAFIVVYCNLHEHVHISVFNTRKSLSYILHIKSICLSYFLDIVWNVFFLFHQVIFGNTDASDSPIGSWYQSGMEAAHRLFGNDPSMPPIVEVGLFPIQGLIICVTSYILLVTWTIPVAYSCINT